MRLAGPLACWDHSAVFLAGAVWAPRLGVFIYWVGCTRLLGLVTPVSWRVAVARLSGIGWQSACGYFTVSLFLPVSTAFCY